MRECETYQVTSVARLQGQVLSYMESYCKKNRIVKIKPRKPKTRVAIFRVMDRSCLDTFEIALHTEDSPRFTVVFEDKLPEVEDLIFCNLDTGYCQLHPTTQVSTLVNALIAFQDLQDRTKNKG